MRTKSLLLAKNAPRKSTVAILEDPGGMKTETFAKLQARLPERIVEEAIRGMLPHTSLGRQLFTKLKVYAGPNHPHQAQKPEELIVQTIPGGNE